MNIKRLFGFKRDYRYWLDKGDGFLRDERYADARDAFAEAMHQLENTDGENDSLLADMRGKYGEAGNRLGQMNLEEAGYALAGGNPRKAEEHLRVALDLAEDGALRKQAEDMLGEISAGRPEITMHRDAHSCSGCGDNADHGASDDHGTDELLHKDDRFELYIHTLPGDLPERYRSLGERFVSGCLLNLDGKGEEALRIFSGLAAEEENDIINYEIALIYYRIGDLSNCEGALRRALDLNPFNPLGYFSLVQLLGETGRIGEALPFLQYMINNDLMPDQAKLLLGDAHVILQDEKSAMDCFSSVLSSTGYGKEAANRLIPLLEKQGRSADAAFLAKKFKKGCC